MYAEDFLSCALFCLLLILLVQVHPVVAFLVLYLAVGFIIDEF